MLSFTWNKQSIDAILQYLLNTSYKVHEFLIMLELVVWVFVSVQMMISLNCTTISYCFCANLKGARGYLKP